MIRFDSDYCEGAHPKVLQKIVDTNAEQTAPYGEDLYCLRAADLILKQCGNPDADVHFLTGGTQTNLTLIGAALRPHQAVVCAKTGHIFVHETGAVEATGHAIIAVSDQNGKLSTQQVLAVAEDHRNDANREHRSKPGLVYLSHPTEAGTIYSREELTQIAEVCRRYGLFLYLDGARLGYALTAKGNDLDLPAIADLCDAFYIGGTKMGALFGEALVIRNPRLRDDFRYAMKQRGAMLAKGRLLGLQFIALFEDGLYYEIGSRANHLAEKIRDACIKKGYPFLAETVTNQQFPILPDRDLGILGEKYVYSFWQRVDETHSAVRFCTGWATSPENAERLAKDIEALP